jgi:hypothetical protein
MARTPRFAAMIAAAALLASIAPAAQAASSGGGDAPDRRAAGYERVLSWSGGDTMACRQSAGAATEVRVYWSGRGYDGGSTGSGGLANVSGSFAISGWTYSTGRPGRTGPVVSLTMASDGYVYLLVGSAVGITREAVVPVWSLTPCAGAQVVTQRQATDRAAAASCATKQEFKRLKRGMTPERVQRLLGAHGRVVSKASYSLIRRYQECGRSRSVVVNYEQAGAHAPSKVSTRYW